MSTYLQPHYKREHLRIIAKHGKAPSCIWDESHTQGGHGFEWANVSGVYTDQLEDYLPMCIPCHRRFDTTDKQRERMRKYNKGKPALNRVKVYQYKDGELINEYPSLTLAGLSVGVGASAIRNNIKGLAKLTAGYEWRITT